MAERTSVSQVVQIGKETTSGTAVAANKQLVSVNIKPGIQSTFKKVVPMGSKYGSIVMQGKEWMEADINGDVASYTELPYLLASLFGTVTPTRNIPSTGLSYTWVWNPSTTAPEDPVTFTVEQGSSVRAHKFAYGMVTGLGLAFTRDDIKLTGKMIGQQLTDGITLTASPTVLANTPVDPGNVGVWMDATSGGLGTTKLTRVLEAAWNVNDKFDALWVIDPTPTSFVAHVEKEPKAQFSVLVEADAAGMALLTTARQGDTKFVRIKATGANIETTYDYTLQLDLAGKITGIEKFEDKDGVYAIKFNFDIVHDATWTKAMSISVTNVLAAL